MSDEEDEIERITAQAMDQARIERNEAKENAAAAKVQQAEAARLLAESAAETKATPTPAPTRAPSGPSNADLARQLKAAQEEIKSQKGLVAAQRQTISSFKKKSASKDTQISKLNKEKKALGETVDNLYKKNKGQAEKIKDLNKTNKGLTNANKDLTNTNSDLSKKNGKLEQTVSAQDKALKLAKSNIEDMHNANVGLLTENTSLLQDNKGLLSENNSARGQIQDLQVQNQGLEAKNEKLAAVAQSLQADNQSQADQLQKAAMENAALLERIQALEQQNAAAQQETQNLKRAAAPVAKMSPGQLTPKSVANSSADIESKATPAEAAQALQFTAEAQDGVGLQKEGLQGKLPGMTVTESDDKNSLIIGTGEGNQVSVAKDGSSFQCTGSFGAKEAQVASETMDKSKPIAMFCEDNDQLKSAYKEALKVGFKLDEKHVADVVADPAKKQALVGAMAELKAEGGADDAKISNFVAGNSAIKAEVNPTAGPQAAISVPASSPAGPESSAEGQGTSTKPEERNTLDR